MRSAAVTLALVAAAVAVPAHAADPTSVPVLGKETARGTHAYLALPAQEAGTRVVDGSATDWSGTVTGFGGTTMRAAEADVPGAVQGKLVNVRFDANTSPALPWTFKPQHPVDRIAIGARDLTFFTARNNSNVPLTGTATFNVTPLQAGQYFSKVQCFCFTEQTLQPGEEMRMPVVFFVDPKLRTDEATKDIDEITLSYTFYPTAS